jgi:hypothetical protein
VTRYQQRKIAGALKRVVKTEMRTGFGTGTRRERMTQLVAQAQQMGLQPDALLTPEGRDALIVIARAVSTQPVRPIKPLRAEWAFIIDRVEHFFLSTSRVMPVRVAS